MYEQLIFTDLDGTLIFSARKKQPGDIICEYKDGEEISCITARQAELLPRLSGVIPVTTRSIEQYRRICFPEGFSPEYALVDNGGTLLVNGIPDREWTENSMRIADECSQELSRCRRALQNDPDRSFEIRLVDGMFLFTKSDSPAQSLERLRIAAGERVNCFAVGAKLYAIPAEINKGGAAMRLKARIAPESLLICAGDSQMDMPLLRLSDIPVLPEDMAWNSGSAEMAVFPRERFPERVTEYFGRICGVIKEE
ncbi:MAG: hypothetical protein ACI4WS_07000 [Oscillospiraceae bacterium]